MGPMIRDHRVSEDGDQGWPGVHPIPVPEVQDPGGSGSLVGCEAGAVVVVAATGAGSVFGADPPEQVVALVCMRR